jgi:hypothetical protein
MLLLQIEFRGKGEVSGVIFTQLKREGDICLYKRSDGYYEVIRARKQKEKTAIIDGNKVIFEEKEIYPTGESWGKFEWCTSNYGKALEYFAIEVEKENNKVQ